MRVAGLVLAGGRSSRYGKQKLFELFEDEPLFMKSVHAFMKSNILSFHIVTNHELAKHFHPYSVICESSSHEGPLAALFAGMSALTEQGYTHVHLLAGDLPGVDDRFVNQLLAYAEQYPEADILLPEYNQQLQPLHAIYHIRCLDLMAKIIPNEKSMKSLYEKANTKIISFSDDAPYFKNINYKKDWT